MRLLRNIVYGGLITIVATIGVACGKAEKQPQYISGTVKSESYAADVYSFNAITDNGDLIMGGARGLLGPTLLNSMLDPGDRFVFKVVERTMSGLFGLPEKVHTPPGTYNVYPEDIVEVNGIKNPMYK